MTSAACSKMWKLNADTAICFHLTFMHGVHSILSNNNCFSGHENTDSVLHWYFSIYIYRSIPYTNQGMCVEVQICPKRTPPFANQATGLMYVYIYIYIYIYIHTYIHTFIYIVFWMGGNVQKGEELSSPLLSTSLSGWPRLEVLAFWETYQVATLVKA